MSSRSTPYSDLVGSRLSTILPNVLIPGSGALMDGAGYIYGLMDEPDYRESSVAPAFIPGVGGYRLGNRIKSQLVKELEDMGHVEGSEDASPVSHAVAEHIGPYTSIAASTLAGAGIGAMAGGRKGAGIGAGAGAAAAIIASIAAAVMANRRKRSARKQIEADSESTWRKYLVPGAAVAGHVHRLDRSQLDREELKDSSDNRKKG